jgi:hypothetical protein
MCVRPWFGRRRVGPDAIEQFAQRRAVPRFTLECAPQLIVDPFDLAHAFSLLL